MKYPIGIQTFEEIINGGYVYVDKTALICELINSGKYYFLSRPRRFGKSLLLSTIEAYFEGKKELFKGLEIEKLEKDWVKHPVIHIDLNVGEFISADALRQRLGVILSRYEDVYGRNPADESISDRFEGLITRAKQAAGKNVVVLIDEYDKPLLSAIGNKKLQEDLRDVLRSFYGVLKSCDKHIRFVMLTGVTKFGRLSVFSGLNNINDISFNERYAAICGITMTELVQTFAKQISDMTVRYKCSDEEMKERLRLMYDGYRFTEAETKVFNPFSLLNAFYRNKMGAYWFASGTPKYLVQLLIQHHYEVCNLEGSVADEERLSHMDTDSSDPIPIIYQSGYLTIKDCDEFTEEFVLGFPNEEVRQGFMEYLVPFYLNRNVEQTQFDISNFKKEIRKGEAEAFMQRLQSLTADISYEILANCEDDFQNMLYIIFTLASLKPIAERRTSDGRIDMVVETDSYVYVMEFKVNGTAQEAIDQINSKNYALPWASDHRKVIKIGANFSTEQRRLTEYIITE